MLFNEGCHGQQGVPDFLVFAGEEDGLLFFFLQLLGGDLNLQRKAGESLRFFWRGWISKL